MSKNEFTCDCNIIHKDSVNHVKKNIPNEYYFNDLADLFKLIGDTTLSLIHISEPTRP